MDTVWPAAGALDGGAVMDGWRSPDRHTPVGRFERAIGRVNDRIQTVHLDIDSRGTWGSIK